MSDAGLRGVHLLTDRQVAERGRVTRSRRDDRRTAPVRPGARPLLGHALQIARDPRRFLVSMPDHGALVEIRVGPARALVVCDPELTRQVLADDRTFDKGGPIYDRVIELVGYGLGTCPHRDHRRQRRLASPAFRRECLPRYAAVMLEEITSTIGAWNDGDVIDPHAELFGMAGRSLVRSLFSAEASVEQLTQMDEDSTTLLTATMRRAVMPAVLARAPWRGRPERAAARLRRNLDAIVASRPALDAGRPDLLTRLAHADDAGPANGGPRLGASSDQLLVFFAAGTETAATTLAWTLHLLARHQRIQARFHAELDRVPGAQPLTFEHLDALELGRRILTEALRLYPPVWVVTRVATRDTELGGCHIAAGSAVVISAYMIHRRPDLYADPERFDPDRHRPQTSPRPRDAGYLPFGGGARSCIGESFATTEMLLALAAICRRWRVDPVAGSRVKTAVGVALRPKGLRLTLTPRGAHRRAAVGVTGVAAVAPARRRRRVTGPR